MEKQNSPNFNEVRDFLQNKIPFFQKVGILVEEINYGKIKLAIRRDPSNLNHLGIYQAGVYMTLAEASGAALLATILDLSDVLLLTRECRVKFAEPAKRYLSYEGMLSTEEINKINRQLEEERKIELTMDVALLNENGTIAAEASMVYYLRTGSSNFIASQRVC